MQPPPVSPLPAENAPVLEPSDLTVVPATPAPGPRRWLTVLIAVAALLVGAGTAFSGLLLAGWRYQPEQHYSVTVFLKAGVTDGQKEAVRVVLTKIPSTDGVQSETSQEAFNKFKAMAKDYPGVLDGVTAAAMPQSFHLQTVSRGDFDCMILSPLGKMPGVDRLIVVQTPRDGHPGADIGC